MQLAIDRRKAKALGLTVPEALLAIADDGDPIALRCIVDGRSGSKPVML
jgi:hypothetical protein